MIEIEMEHSSLSCLKPKKKKKNVASVRIKNNERARIGGIAEADEDVTIKTMQRKINQRCRPKGKEEQMCNSFYSVNNWYVLIAIPRRVNAEPRA